LTFHFTTSQQIQVTQLSMKVRCKLKSLKDNYENSTEQSDENMAAAKW